MLSELSDPIVDVSRLPISSDPKITRNVLGQYMNSGAGAASQKNPDGAPGIFVYDSTKPLAGLQSFGFEGASAIEDLFANVDKKAGYENKPTCGSNRIFSGEPLTDGDLVILQARPRAPHSGGSTALGRFRNAIWKAAMSEGTPSHDFTEKGFNFLWITDFPLFTLDDGIDPGQGGSAGFSATHHPFTAPKTAADVDLLFEDPLKAKADHYDLVLNGVELGGGSRRIHNADMQKFVMGEVLKVCIN